MSTSSLQIHSLGHKPLCCLVRNYPDYFSLWVCLGLMIWIISVDVMRAIIFTVCGMKGWDSGLNTEEKVSWASVWPVLYFLVVDAMWPAGYPDFVTVIRCDASWNCQPKWTILLFSCFLSSILSSIRKALTNSKWKPWKYLNGLNAKELHKNVEVSRQLMWASGTLTWGGVSCVSVCKIPRHPSESLSTYWFRKPIPPPPED